MMYKIYTRQWTERQTPHMDVKQLCERRRRSMTHQKDGLAPNNHLIKEPTQY